MPLKTRLYPVQQMAIYPADTLAVEVLQQQREFEGVGDVAPAVQAIRDIAESVCERLDAGAALGDILFTLNDQLFNVLGFSSIAATQATPQQMLLWQVLQQRYAEPFSLGILYISVGRWLGLPLNGCEFPGRFLVHYHDDEGEVIIDPAAGGVQLQQDDLHSLLCHRFGEVEMGERESDLLSDVADHNLVLRMLRRLKLAYLNCGEAAMALRVQEKIMQLVPDMPACFRDRGQIFELLDCPRAAAEDYSRYIDLAPDAQDAPPLRQRLPLLLRNPRVLH